MKDVCIFWTLPSTDIIHRMQDYLGIERYMNVNGEQYVRLDEEQYARLMKWQAEGLLELRNKKLVMINGRLTPDVSIYNNHKK